MSKQGLWGWRKSVFHSGIVCLLLGVLLTIMIEALPRIQGEMERHPELRMYTCVWLKDLFLRYQAYCVKQDGPLLTGGYNGANEDGARNLRAGRAMLVGMTRSLTHEEFEDCVKAGVLPTSHLVAYDALAILVHASNPVKQMTPDQLRDIYMEKIGSWKELGGPDAQIQRFVLDAANQEAVGLCDHVIKEGSLARDVQIFRTREDMIERLWKSPQGIGFVRAQTYFQMKEIPKEVKFLEVNGVALTRESVRSGNYPIAWPVLFYTNGHPAWGSDLHKLVTLHLSKEGQSMVEASGYCAVTSYK